MISLNSDIPVLIQLCFCESYLFSLCMMMYLYLLWENSKLNLFKETLYLKKSDINFVSVKCIYWFCYFIMFSFLLILECNIWNVIFVFKIQVILYIYKLSEWIANTLQINKFVTLFLKFIIFNSIRQILVNINQYKKVAI